MTSLTFASCLCVVLLWGSHLTSQVPVVAASPDKRPRHVDAPAVFSVVLDTTPVVLADSLTSPVRWDSTGWRGRVVVGEYLTGIVCPSCQSHEQAFDLLLQHYPTTVFVPIAYHGINNIPIADPADSVWERMYAWYGNEPYIKGLFPQESIESHKAWDDWIDGHAAIPEISVSHPSPFWTGSERYAALTRVIDSSLRTPPRAAVHVTAVPNGGTVVTQITVDSVVGSAASLTHLSVRLVLLEDTVQLILNPKSNPHQVRLKLDHYMVVRSAARSRTLPMGLPLTLRNGRGTVSYTFDVAHVQRTLWRNRALGVAALPGLSDGSSSYLKGYTKQQLQDLIEYFGQIGAMFPDGRNWTMDLTRLHVVAFVQDLTTGDVLQAQIVPITAGPRGERLSVVPPRD